MDVDGFIFDATKLIRDIDPEFSAGVCILHTGSAYLDAGFVELLRSSLPQGAIACTSPVMDITTASATRYQRNARCFAMYFVQHPAKIGEKMAWAAVVHEAGHYVDYDGPEKTNPDDAAAIKQAWTNGLRSQGANSHGPRWVRATAHLAYRAQQAGVDIDYEMLFGQYVKNHEQVMPSLASELGLTVPIKRLLAMDTPAKFRRLF